MLITSTPQGLFCPAGNFHIDAWGSNLPHSENSGGVSSSGGGVEKNIITHAHSDHARLGAQHYLSTPESAPILRHRLGPQISLQTLHYNQPLTINSVRVSLHPAGHLLGSAQVRLEHKGHVTVITGDYKRAPDPTCSPFEIVPCHSLLSECTFGMPIYRWPPPEKIFADIHAWWHTNIANSRTSVIYAYSLGKAQRLLSGLNPSTAPILLHGAITPIVDIYRAAGIPLPPTLPASPENAKLHKGRALIIAPPSAANSLWLRKFEPASEAIASGWMAVRGRRRRASVDRGFILSDHVDWPALLQTISETTASEIALTHGFTHIVVRYLQEKGLNARDIATQFTGDEEADPSDPTSSHLDTPPSPDEEGAP